MINIYIYINRCLYINIYKQPSKQPKWNVCLKVNPPKVRLQKKTPAPRQQAYEELHRQYREVSSVLLIVGLLGLVGLVGLVVRDLMLTCSTVNCHYVHSSREQAKRETVEKSTAPAPKCFWLSSWTDKSLNVFDKFYQSQTLNLLTCFDQFW